MWRWRHFDLFIIEVWLFILEIRVFWRWLQSDDWMAPLLSSSTFENKHSENHRRHISKASASEWRERVITVVQAGQEHVLNATQGPVHSNSKQATPVTCRSIGKSNFYCRVAHREHQRENVYTHHKRRTRGEWWGSVQIYRNLHTPVCKKKNNVFTSTKKV